MLKKYVNTLFIFLSLEALSLECELTYSHFIPTVGYVLSSCVNARRTHPFHPFKLVKYKTSATTFRCTFYLHHRIFGEPTFSRSAYSSAAVGTCTSPYVVSNVRLPYVFSTQQKGIATESKFFYLILI